MYKNQLFILLLLLATSVGAADNSQSQIINQIILNNEQLKASANQISGKPGEQIGPIVNEISFYTKLRMKQISNFKELCFPIIPEQIEIQLQKMSIFANNLQLLLKNIQIEQLQIIDKSLATKIASETDSIFATLDKTDLILKCKIDSLYVNATEITNGNYYRTITIASKTSEKLIFWGSIFILMLALTGIVSIIVNKKKFISLTMYILIVLTLIGISGITLPQKISLAFGDKYYVPVWETVTQYGHHANKVFFDKCRDNVPYQTIYKRGEIATNYFLTAIYTTVGQDIAKDVYQNIQFINAILYPPAPIPDSAFIFQNKINGDSIISYNPAWFSSQNFSKINAWNRMVGRKNVKGLNINIRKYNTDLNYLLHENYIIKNTKIDERLFLSPANRVKLENLVKIKIAL